VEDKVNLLFVGQVQTASPDKRLEIIARGDGRFIRLEATLTGRQFRRRRRGRRRLADLGAGQKPPARRKFRRGHRTEG
jgi:hypothetical protein